MFGHEGGFGFGYGFGMWFFWLFMIAVVVLVVRGLSGDSISSGSGYENRPPEKTALEILEERYARGDIDEAEFNRRRRSLEH